jgi:hypothetical protein
MNMRISAASLSLLLSISASASADSINVLWWTYADPASEYRTGIANLAGFVGTLPAASGLQWNLTFFDATSPTPNFADYDVLVIESGEPFRTGAPGGPLATPEYSGILNNKTAIQAARGDRTFISGADADFHAVRGDTGNVPNSEGGVCSPPLIAPNCWDGALGHVVNSINWAGSGRGLGIVSFVAAEFPGSQWWLDPNSFLRDELNGFLSLFGTGSRENVVVIPAAAAAFPVNSGLTALGLSDWDQSFHAGFSHAVPGYTPIVDATGHADTAVAIASTATAAGGTSGAGVTDTDGDGIPDNVDNCSAVANSDQRDTNGDGYGNRCDADLNNDGSANFTDLAMFRQKFGSQDPNADFSGDGVVNFTDLAILRQMFGKPPGPSGNHPNCPPTCP